jgi:DNA-binding protein HU-beta
VTKQEFVDEVARRANLGKREAGEAVDAMLETITDTLKRRDSINFTGFGKFATSERKARMGVNPRNPSQKVHIAAATVPKFTAGSHLKASVKGG